MKSLKCQACSLVQWADNPNCKRCGVPLEASAAQPQVQAQPVYAYQATPYAPTAGPRLKTGLALTSMILAIVSLPLMFLLIGLLVAPVAIVLGIIAVRNATKKPGVYGGKGFAIAGISVGSVVCFFFVPMIAAIAIPNILAAARAANEGSARSTVEKIAAAQLTYAATYGAGNCGDLVSLSKEKLIPNELAAGKKNGYKFVAKGNISDTYGCEVQATPASKSEGTKSFYFSSSDNVMRMSRDGLPANHNDPPLDSSTIRASR